MGNTDSIPQCTMSNMNIVEDCSMKQSLNSISEYYTQTDYKIPCNTLTKITHSCKELKNIIVIQTIDNLSFYDTECKKLISSHPYANVQYFIIDNQFFIITKNNKHITCSMLYPEYKLINKLSICSSSFFDYFYRISICDFVPKIYYYKPYLILEYTYNKSGTTHVHVVICNDDDLHHTFADYIIKCICKNNVIIIQHIKTNKYAYYNINMKKCAYTNKRFIDNVGETIIEYDEYSQKVLMSSTKSLVFDDSFEHEYIIIDD